MPIVGGNTKFQPVYVDDIAKSVVKVLQTDTSTFKKNIKIFELGGPRYNEFSFFNGKMLSIIYRKNIITLPFWLAKAMCPIILY